MRGSMAGVSESVGVRSFEPTEARRLRVLGGIVVGLALSAVVAAVRVEEKTVVISGRGCLNEAGRLSSAAETARPREVLRAVSMLSERQVAVFVAGVLFVERA